MRWKLWYLAGLAVVSTAVFFSTYYFGRNASLEAELERLTAPRQAVAPEKSRGIPSLEQVEPKPEAAPVPQEVAGEPLGEGIQATRSPLASSGLVIVADLPALQQRSAGQGGELYGGLVSFLARPPAGLQIGLRPLSGAAGVCGPVEAIRKLGSGATERDLAAALAAVAGREPAPRNPAGAVQSAAGDFEAVDGERAVVVLTGGEEGCNAELCGSGVPPGGSAQRVHVLMLAPPPHLGGEPGLPTAGASQPVFEPAWEAPYRCLAERNGGTIAAVSTATELEAALRRIAGELESSVLVKALHYNGQEVGGLSPGGESGWGATLRLGGGAAADARTRESAVFPSAFGVRAGVYSIKARYGGQERTAAVAVAPGERVEVRFSFTTGGLFLQARDAADNEIVGDSTVFRCAWGVEVFGAGAEEAGPVATTCTFPARLELVPGTYRVRARWKGEERIIEEATVEAGTTAVFAVSFGNEGN